MPEYPAFDPSKKACTLKLQLDLTPTVNVHWSARAHSSSFAWSFPVIHLSVTRGFVCCSQAGALQHATGQLSCRAVHLCEISQITHVGLLSQLSSKYRQGEFYLLTFTCPTCCEKGKCMVVLCL